MTPSLRSLHRIKVKERIDYKILSLTYKVLTTTELSYLYDLISLQPLHSTRSSNVVTLVRPPSYSSLKVNNHSLRCASPRFWNKLPEELRQPVDACHCHPIFLSPIHHHHFHYASIHLCSNSKSKLTFSINLIHDSSSVKRASLADGKLTKC